MDLRNVKIETERLLLKAVTEEYTEDIFREFDDEITKYMYPAAHDDIEFTKNLVKKWRAELEAGTRLLVVVLDKNSKEFLGFFGVEDLEQRDIEMGGWLKKAAHGNKYGQEAVAALKKWADENVDYDYIKWPCAKKNIASCKVAESLGGEIKKEYEKTNESGYTWDYVEYWIYPQ